MVNVSQLLGRRFVVGARFRWADVSLDDSFPNNQPDFTSRQATLYKATGFVLYQHPSGVFAQADGNWYGQRNYGYGGEEPGQDFFQGNIYLGYRFPRDHGLVRIGLLNVTGQNYQLNPLTAYVELPRDRVVEVTFGFQF